MESSQLPLFSSKETYGYDLSELFWVNHQPLLLSRGYKLRPRYGPGWTGSWKNNSKKPMECEDSVANWIWNVLDAIRIQDNVKVLIKLVPTWSEQIPIARYLSCDALRKDPRNHAVPILDVISLPDDDEMALLVMPFLREFDDPPFQHLAECVEALHQVLEGLVFLHDHNIAHRDACNGNIMMDASRLIPGGFHHVTRNSPDGVKWLGRKITDLTRLSVAPVNYYFIDFGLSRHFPSFEERGYVLGRYGQDKTVPELSVTVPYDPFALDIYQLGGVIRELVENYHGLGVFRPLAEAMCRKRPSDRPTASEALRQFEGIVSKLGPWALKARVVLYKEWLPAQIWQVLRQCLVPSADKGR